MRGLMAAAFLALTSTASLAEEMPSSQVNRAEELKAAAAPSNPAVIFQDQLALADETLALARSSRSPDVYLAAASLYSRLGGIRSGDQEGARVSAAPEDFWNEASAAAAADPTALAALARLRAREGKWLIGATGSVAFTLLPGNASGRVFTYRIGEPAVITIRPGGSPARMTVFDQNGRVACRTEFDEPKQRCQWTPRWTGAFRIVVERRSGNAPVQLVAS